MTTDNIMIRVAEESDFDAIWEIFHQVIKSGDSYTFSPTTTKLEAYQLWMLHKYIYVAVINDEIVGTYYLRDNQLDLGSHVSNAGYMVHPDKCGNGIGKALAKHSLAEAKRLGYQAMQFNFVISTNTSAIALWKKMGFEIIGTSPKAFKHNQFGYVDTYIMHRFI